MLLFERWTEMIDLRSSNDIELDWIKDFSHFVGDKFY